MRAAGVTDGTCVPVTSRAEESATFLYALARRIDTRLLVLVPAARRARSLWFVPADDHDDAEIDYLETIGRALLQSGAGFVHDWDAQRSARFTGDERLAVTVPRSPEGDVAGVVVAKKRAGQWSRSEHALLEFAGEFYRRQLTYCARHPLPSPLLDIGFGRVRADNAELESGMRAAADKGELYLLYQPEIDLRSGRVVAVEALTRWLHPRRGELGPETFIALAEQSDLIQVLGTWVVEESFRDFALWRGKLPELDLVLRINVSPLQLRRPGFADDFAAALRRHDMHGAQVCIELTENVAFADADADVVVEALRRLRALGIRSALDDLASGYSTLSRLRTLRVDLVKLDRGLVSGIDRDERARAIAAGLVRLAGDLGIDVIAEGVETAAEMATLVSLGCRSAQGHYFARPMVAADIPGYLRDREDQLTDV